MPLLDLKDVSKAYGDKLLLDKVSLTVTRGARIGLIGRNGEGKSTLLKIMAGLIPPDRGEVTRRGGAKVAYLAQTPEVKPGQRVFHAVAEGLGEVAAALAQFHAAATDADLARMALRAGDRRIVEPRRSRQSRHPIVIESLFLLELHAADGALAVPFVQAREVYFVVHFAVPGTCRDFFRTHRWVDFASFVRHLHGSRCTVRVHGVHVSRVHGIGVHVTGHGFARMIARM